MNLTAFLIFLDEIYKSAKLNGIDGIRNGQASVSDETEEDDAEAGPELPPDFEDEAVGDEEGRFFGGGITRDTADVLDFIDERDQDDSAVRSLLQTPYKGWG